MEPILQIALATLFTSLGAWIQSKIEKRKQSLRPPRMQLCVDPHCQRSAVWCEVHGAYHKTHEHAAHSDGSELARTPKKGTRL